MSQVDEFSLMADEVIRDIQSKHVSFHRAFSWAAHRRHVWYHLQKGQYNSWFQIVRARVSRREKTLLKKSLEGERPWQHGRTHQKTPSVETYPPETDVLDPWSIEPPKPEDFNDNIGFVHFRTSYLEEAPS